MAKTNESPFQDLAKKLDAKVKRLRILSKPEGWRPQTRADCEDVPRPCPYMGCRYNLSMDLNPYGSVRWRESEPWDEILRGKDNCALDVAARGPHTLQEIADLSGVCRERIRQELDVALEKLRPAMTHNSSITGMSHVYDYSKSPEDACMALFGLNPKEQDDRARYRKLVDAMRHNGDDG